MQVTQSHRSGTGRLLRAAVRPERRAVAALALASETNRAAGIVDLYADRLSALSAVEEPEPSAAPRVPEPSPTPRPMPAPRRFVLGRRLGAAVLALGLALSGFSQVAQAHYQYVVQPGDTLHSIAQQFGVEATDITRADDVVGAPYLYPGEIVVVPGPGEEPGAIDYESVVTDGATSYAEGVYVVQPGDWYQGIAEALGVSVDALFEVNGIGWNTPLAVGDRLLIPAGGAEPLAEASVPGAAAISYVWVPAYEQQRSLSCEYAAAYIATSAYGYGISEYEFDVRIPITLNPHYGYRGNIHGWWGNYDDYGIYPEPLVPVLNEFGFAGEVAYTDGRTPWLTDHLDAGHPVIVWLAIWGNTGVQFDDEGVYTIFAGEHVVVAYGYDEAGVWISDPGDGAYKHLDWATFRWMWGISDGMSLAVYQL
jgi:LysM repeat protein